MIYDFPLLILCYFFAQLLHPITAQYSPRLPIDIVVGLPIDEGHIFKNPFKLTLPKSQPVFDVAVEDVYYKHRLMPPGSLRVVYEDTQLSDAIAPQRMVEHYCNRSVDAVMGMAYVYALAPVARMSAFWFGGVPVFTTTGLVDELGDRKEFPLLTRMMGTYKTLANLMYEIARSQGWHHFYFIFNDEAGIEGGKGLPRSECYFSLYAIRNRIQKEKDIIWHVDMFSTRNASRRKYGDLLKKVSMSSNSEFLWMCSCTSFWLISSFFFVFLFTSLLVCVHEYFTDLHRVLSLLLIDCSLHPLCERIS
ncbi:hypothetical protein NECAME_11952 [Necator americanus]|uniref:Receptor ligand binding region domain-containing protein n=1 Tax=Necator americanus TaxID=51031 RepID=W2T490_NECAM|nr:hypothetical protein NECAME_11952 [Necator americanus]ETN76061.1 hypothetical protein NECAME_11952 [Necator americanus]